MTLMPVADALSAILGNAGPLPEEMVALDAAHHRVLARDVAARRTQPPEAMSAMDGYAVRSADAADLSARLKVGISSQLSQLPSVASRTAVTMVSLLG